jgi:hypothetical protein
MFLLNCRLVNIVCLGELSMIMVCLDNSCFKLKKNIGLSNSFQKKLNQFEISSDSRKVYNSDLLLSCSHFVMLSIVVLFAIFV